MSPEPKSKAQIAYETYNQSRDNTLWWRWSALPFDEANAWHNVVNTITSLPVPDPTADDPALLLAQRIALISAETGIKPRMIWSIIGNVEWEAKCAAEKAQEAAAPQENPTDA